MRFRSLAASLLCSVGLFAQGGHATPLCDDVGQCPVGLTCDDASDRCVPKGCAPDVGCRAVVERCDVARGICIPTHPNGNPNSGLPCKGSDACLAGEECQAIAPATGTGVCVNISQRCNADMDCSLAAPFCNRGVDDAIGFCGLTAQDEPEQCLTEGRCVYLHNAEQRVDQLDQLGRARPCRLDAPLAETAETCRDQRGETLEVGCAP